MAGGQLTLNNSVIAGNQAIGGNGARGNFSTSLGDASTHTAEGGSGGSAAGGGLYLAGGTVTLSQDTLSGNRATGGAGGYGGGGDKGTVLDLISSGGAGGAADGAGICVTGGTVTCIDSTLTGNIARAGNGGTAAHLGYLPVRATLSRRAVRHPRTARAARVIQSRLNIPAANRSRCAAARHRDRHANSRRTA